MKKVFLMCVASLLFIGCASGGSSSKVASKSFTGNVTDFNSAISAYNLEKNSKYLKLADKYATSESDKAILERKMVDYLGVNKVFDVSINHKLSKFNASTSAGYFIKSRNSTKNNMLSIEISVKKDLPFTLKYNSYKIGINIQKHIKSKYSHLSYYRYRKGSSPEIKIKEEKETIYSNRSIVLSPQNKWTYMKMNISDKVIFYSESSALATDKYFLLDLKYVANLGLSKTNIVDRTNNLIWQNSFQDTNGNPPLVKSKYASDIKICRKLGKGWRLPFRHELELYKKNKFPDYGLNYWHYKEYHASQLSEYVRCVKIINPTFIDKLAKLEWDDDAYLSELRRTKDSNSYGKGIRTGGEKYCALRGHGWRVPTISEFRNFYSKGYLFRDNKDLVYKAKRTYSNQHMHYVTTTHNVYFEIEYNLNKNKYIPHTNTTNNWGLVKCVRNIK